MVLPYRIVEKTFIKVCDVIVVGVVTIYGANHMIRCGQTVVAQFSAFLHDYGGGGVMLLLVFCLVITGAHGIGYLFPSLPIFPSGVPSASSL